MADLLCFNSHEITNSRATKNTSRTLPRRWKSAMTFGQKSILNLTITEMDEQVLTEIRELKKLIYEQNMLQKEVLNFNEAAVYLEVSHSHLYKLTSTGTIPAYKPNGKKLYFNREELNKWLLSNRQASLSDIEEEVNQFQLKSGRAK